LETVDCLKAFDFAKLRQPCFEFRLPTFSHEELTSAAPHTRFKAEQRWGAFSRSGVHGLMAIDRKGIKYQNLRQRREASAAGDPTRPRAGEGENGALVAYTELNKRVREALAWLTL
jgi:hypothetical protein